MKIEEFDKHVKEICPGCKHYFECVFNDQFAEAIKSGGEVIADFSACYEPTPSEQINIDLEGMK